MTIPSNDRPDLTAYALGELHADQAAEVHALLAETPGSATELEQIEAVTDALRHGVPITHYRLTPEQRHAVLRPSGLPRLIQPMMPRRPAAPRPSRRPFLVHFAQMAAIIAVTGFAFLAGKYVAETSEPGLAVTDPADTAPAVVALAPAHPPAPKVVAAVGAQVEAVEQTAPAPAVLAKKPETTVNHPTVAAAESAGVTGPAPKAAPVKATKSTSLTAAVPAVPKQAVESSIAIGNPSTMPGFGFTSPASSDAFTSVSKRPNNQFNLRPAGIRPVPVKPSGSQFASPAPVIPAQGAKDNSNSSGKPRAPELFIQSWKAEVASCPWNEANRLLRVVVQLPADQPAAKADAVYPMQIAFDSATVREYRLLCERHVPAPDLRSAGVHVVWYEFAPNGKPGAVRETSWPIATVTLSDGRFTTQTVGPFDASKLQVLDRGQSWQSAREDFLFESSIVGFGMLLRGTQQTGSLDHDLVLTLAEKAKGTDTTGERIRFIRLVQNARKAAGL